MNKAGKRRTRRRNVLINGLLHEQLYIGLFCTIKKYVVLSRTRVF